MKIVECEQDSVRFHEQVSYDNVTFVITLDIQNKQGLKSSSGEYVYFLVFLKPLLDFF